MEQVSVELRAPTTEWHEFVVDWLGEQKRLAESKGRKQAAEQLERRMAEVMAHAMACEIGRARPVR